MQCLGVFSFAALIAIAFACKECMHKRRVYNLFLTKIQEQLGHHRQPSSANQLTGQLAPTNNALGHDHRHVKLLGRGNTAMMAMGPFPDPNFGDDGDEEEFVPPSDSESHSEFEDDLVLPSRQSLQMLPMKTGSLLQMNEEEVMQTPITKEDYDQMMRHAKYRKAFASKRPQIAAAYRSAWTHPNHYDYFNAEASASEDEGDDGDDSSWWGDLWEGIKEWLEDWFHGQSSVHSASRRLLVLALIVAVVVLQFVVLSKFFALLGISLNRSIMKLVRLDGRTAYKPLLLAPEYDVNKTPAIDSII